MGCFCRHTAEAVQDATPTPEKQPEPDPEQDAEQPDPPRAETLTKAVAGWLASRWLPAPPWKPDPAWQDLDLPDPPMSPESLGVVLALLQAQQSCSDDLGVALDAPAQLDRLSRIVATMNRRMPELAETLDDTPWEAVSALNDQADAVQAATSSGALAPPPGEPPPPLAPWRPLLAKMKALAPLIAISQTLQMPLDAPELPEQLADRVRQLRGVVVPALKDPMTVYRLISRYSAIDRLQKSLGADPRSVPFERVKSAVDRKVAKTAAALPPDVQEDGTDALPQTPPNPGALLSPQTISRAQRLTPAVSDRLRWQAPQFSQLPVLTSAAPVAKLASLLQACGIPAVRSSPCDGGCDARAAMADPAT